MSKQVIFNQPDGFITVTDGLKKWVISKEEAKYVSVNADETRTPAREAGTLFAALVTFVPVERSKKITYEVKIKTKSGEEVELYSGENLNSAYDMVNRIGDFTKEGIFSDEKFTGNSNRIEKKRTGLKVAGIFEITSTPFVVITLLYIYYGYSYEGYYEIIPGFRHVLILTAIGVIAILPVIGGICALVSKHWMLALAGSIVSLIFWLLGLPALVLISIYKDGFNQSKQSTESG